MNYSQAILHAVDVADMAEPDGPPFMSLTERLSKADHDRRIAKLHALREGRRLYRQAIDDAVDRALEAQAER